MQRALISGLVFLHRWVGVTLGLVMLMWCLSGVVMMYVPYPSLSEARREAALPPLANLPLKAPKLSDDSPARRFEVEMANGQPVVSLAGGRRGGGQHRGGAEEAKPSPDQMLAVARGFGSGAVQAEVLKVDQWMLEGAGRSGPFYRYDLKDPAHTWVYVSSQTGRAVQIVNGPERFWNWLGAVPHWLYPTILRSNGALWTQVVIYSSLVGTFLTIVGLVLGIIRIKKGRLSPYKGWHMWHHVIGLVFGLFLLTWVFSGLLSMNPWGLLEGGRGRDDAAGRLAGDPPTWGDARPAIQAALASPAAQGAVSLNAAPFDGKLYIMAHRPDGSEVRLDAKGAPTPFGEFDQRRVLALFGDRAKGELMTQEDAYYFSSMGERGFSKVILPVLRIIEPDGVRYYVSATTGQVIRRIDGDRQAYRWLQEGLHTLNLAPLMRLRPVWDILMIVLLAGASAVCVTGLWIGGIRIGLIRPRSRRKAAAQQPS